MRRVLCLALLSLGCRQDPATSPSAGDSGAVDPRCPSDGQALARLVDADDEVPGEAAVALPGDLMLANDVAAFVITAPNQGSTYYHYGGIVADAVAMDGCAYAGEDKLDEVGLVLVDIDLGNVAQSTLRAFRGDTAEIVNDGRDGEAAVVRVTGTDDVYWLVEYTLINAAVSSGGKGLSEPFGLEWVLEYTLRPGSSVLELELILKNTGDKDLDLASAALISVGGTMDTYVYAPTDLELAGFGFDLGMPWFLATDGEDALAYTVEEGNLAYMGVSGVQVAVDVNQALSDPLSMRPGQTDRRTMFLSVGGGAGTSATEPLAALNPEPVPDQRYVLGWVAGTVRDDAGEPVAEADIAIQARAPGADWGTLDRGRSDSSGAFVLPLPDFESPWDWRLVASASGRHDSEAVEVNVGEEGVSLVLSQPGALRTNIVDGDGEASPARLALDPVDGGARVDLWVVGSEVSAVPPGTYEYTATRGYEYSVTTGTIDVPEDGEASLDLVMVHLVDTTGWVSIDTHVHSSDSPDSRVAPVDVLEHAAAHGLDIVLHTEHEHIVDRSSLPADTGLQPWVSSILGEEVTAVMPEHLTMFPAEPDGSPRGGIVEWYARDIDEIFGLMRERSGGGVNIMNHPSYLDTIGWDRLLAEPTLDDPTLLGLTPGAAIWSWNLDGIEVMNGHGNPFLSGNRRWDNWQSMLNAGHPVVAVGCSDSHDGDQVGFPRTYLPASSDAPSEVGDEEVVAAFQGGNVFASAGAFARVSLDGAELGELVQDTDGEVVLDVHIEAIPEIDVTFVSIFVNCDEVLTVPATDPGGVVKLSESLDLSLTEDSHITLAAFGEERLPAGLPSFNPSRVPRVLTSPIYVDVDGNGMFDPPGGRECAVFLEAP